MRTFSEDQIREHAFKLKPSYSQIIELHHLQGHDYEKIAGLLIVPLGTVKSRLHRARAALGEIVDAAAAPAEPQQAA